MSKLLMSNSEVLAICRNRSEQKHLSDKLDRLDHVAFQSKDAIQQDLKTWRKFRRDNFRNSGWSPKSIRPEPGEDVFCPASSSGRSSGGIPNSPTQGKDASFTKPWAYSYSQISHNKVYKELAQVSQNSQKALDLSLRSKSLDSTTEEEQPALLKHVKTAQTLSRVASAMVPSKNKLLALRQNDELNSVVKPSKTTKANKMASKISTIQAVNKFSNVCAKDKIKSDVSPGEDANDTLMKSISAMKGLAKSKKMFSCSKCGQGIESSDKEERLPKVALAAKGLHRAQTLLKLSATHNEPVSDNQIFEEEKPRTRTCCAKCRTKSQPTLKMSISPKEKPVNKSQSKFNKSNRPLNPTTGNSSKPNARRRKLSSVSDLSEEQIRKLQVAREKVSKCFEIPCYDEKINGIEADKNDCVATKMPGNFNAENSFVDDLKAPNCKTASLEMGIGEANDEGGIKSTLCAPDSKDRRFTLGQKDGDSKDISQNKKDEFYREPNVKKQSLQSLNGVFQELSLVEEDSPLIDLSCDTVEKIPDQHLAGHLITDLNEEEEYPSDISHQQVMKVIQEEVIDKLNKLTKKQKSPTFVRKFSTISRASNVFKIGVHRKKKTSKTSGVDVFTRIAKFMLFEVWRRRRERLRLLEQEEINKCSKKISQAKFRATLLSLTKPNGQDNSAAATDDGSSYTCIEQTIESPTSSQMLPQRKRRMAVTILSAGEFGTKYRNRKSSGMQMFDASCSFDDDDETQDNPNSNMPNYIKMKQNEQNYKHDVSNQNEQNTGTHSSPRKQLWHSTTTQITRAVTFNADSVNNNNIITNQNTQSNNDDLTNGNDNFNQSEQNPQNYNSGKADNDLQSTSYLLKYPNKNRKPPWMTGSDSLLHTLKPDVYYKGIRLSNYVCPEKRYLTVKRKNAKKDLSVRWHSAVGAMVNKHEISQEPMLAEKTFPKQARHRALHKMIEDNHAPAPDDTAQIHNEMLNSRIQDFLHSVEPYRLK